jgi:hypothetical protein
MRRAGMNSKHRDDKVFRTSSPLEPSMSFSELRHLRLPSTNRGARRGAPHCRSERIDTDDVVLLWPPRQDPSQQNLPAAPPRSAWRAFVRSVSTALLSFSDILSALLCWITAQFLAGCADYAQAMSLVPVTVEEAVEIAEPSKPAPCADSATVRASRPAPTLQVLRAHEPPRREIESGARGAP